MNLWRPVTLHLMMFPPDKTQSGEQQSGVLILQVCSKACGRLCEPSRLHRSRLENSETSVTSPTSVLPWKICLPRKSCLSLCDSQTFPPKHRDALAFHRSPCSHASICLSPPLRCPSSASCFSLTGGLMQAAAASFTAATRRGSYLLSRRLFEQR